MKLTDAEKQLFDKSSEISQQNYLRSNREKIITTEKNCDVLVIQSLKKKGLIKNFVVHELPDSSLEYTITWDI